MLEKRCSSPAKLPMEQNYSRTPAAIVCNACNREFFSRSLPIHQKTCFQKNAFVDLVCTRCNSTIRSGCVSLCIAFECWVVIQVLLSNLVRSGRFHAHEESCSGVQQQQAAAANAEHSHATIERQENQRGVVPNANADQGEELNEPDEDGRIRCKKCGRGFHEDRIAKHQSVCRDNPKNPSQRARYNPAAETQKTLHSPTSLRRKRSKAKGDPSAAKDCLRSNTDAFQKPNVRPSHAATYVSRSYDFAGLHLQRHGGNVREQDKKRFDIVLRDAAQRQQCPADAGRCSSSSGMSAKSLNLLASNATSTANPLATNRFMAAASIRSPTSLLS